MDWTFNKNLNVKFAIPIFNQPTEASDGEWWFVKKHTTDEYGYVPKNALLDHDSYVKFLQKKLREKINQLPVFDDISGKTVPPKFITKLQPITTVTDGHSIHLSVVVEGFPNPNLTWFKNTNIIRSTQDFTVRLFSNFINHVN